MKSAVVFKYVLFAIGLSLLIGAAYIYLDKKSFLDKAIVTQGTVLESIKSIADHPQFLKLRPHIPNNFNSTYYHPVISFKTKTDENITFIASANSTSPLYGNGKSVEIIYDPAHPEEAIIKKYYSALGIPLLMGFFGILFFLMLSVFHFSQKKAKYIFDNGIRILTNFDSVQPTYTIRSKFFRIYTYYFDPDTNTVKVFKSKKLLFDPTEFIRSKTITVILHPENPKKYLMDISFFKIV